MCNFDGAVRSIYKHVFKTLLFRAASIFHLKLNWQPLYYARHVKVLVVWTIFCFQNWLRVARPPAHTYMIVYWVPYTISCLVTKFLWLYILDVRILFVMVRAENCIVEHFCKQRILIFIKWVCYYFRSYLSLNCCPVIIEFYMFPRFLSEHPITLLCLYLQRYIMYSIVNDFQWHRKLCPFVAIQSLSGSES